VSSQIVNRVPVIALSYWIIKIIATTLGETGADTFSHTLHLGYASASLIFMGIFLVFLIKKLASREYTPILYWLTFTATSLAGTAISDFMDRTLGLGYMIGSSVLLLLLSITLWWWYSSEKSLSVEAIYTTRAEVYYWLAFLISNTLGTAVGDFLADDIGLGFAKGAFLIGGLLIIISLFHYYTKISSIFLFWIAFVLTRPFGATFGDFLTKPINEGGVNLGTIGSSTFFLAILVILTYREHQAHRK